MASNLRVHFDLGEYGDYPDLEQFSIAPDGSDVRVRKEPGNYCEIVIDGTVSETNELELEMSGGGWTASASFDIPVTPEAIRKLRECVTGGHVKLKLGEYEILSEKDFNESLFRENYFDFYGN
jgi:hypothetical protein